MTEAQLLAEVTALCDRLGLLWHHDPDSRQVMGSPGFPDLVIVGLHGMLTPEVKGDDGETSADQDRWGWYLGRFFVWRLWGPGDWTSGSIRHELEAIA